MHMGTDQATIHAYNTHAKHWVERVKLAHEYLEKPAMYALLPDLYEKRVLCVGCGTGEECAYIKSSGAKEVVGIDVSEGMIELARKKFPDMQFEVMDLEHLIYADDSFDLVYSSMTMHYLEDWSVGLREVWRVLKKDGQFLFSTNHPVSHTTAIERDAERTRYVLGYEKIKKDRAIRTFGDYFDTGMQETTWPGNFTIHFYNKPISEMVREITASNFSICAIQEPKPVEAVKSVDAGFYKTYSKIPLVILFLLEKAIVQD